MTDKLLINADLLPLFKGAENGDRYSQLVLGLKYFNGEGVPKDEFKAIRYWNKMILNKTKNHNIAYSYYMYHMGLFYYHSFKSIKAAGFWFANAYYSLIASEPEKPHEYYIKDWSLEICLQGTKQFEALNDLRKKFYKSNIAPFKK